MKTWIKTTALTAMLALTATQFVRADAPAAKPAEPARQPADQPAPKLGKDGKMDGHFAQLHERFLKQAKAGNIDLLFLGDSITEGWAGGGKAVWEKNYAPLKAANFGISGDRTEHVLWRMDNGELDGISPKVVVLMIGTNNSGGWSADEIAAADTKIVKELHQKLPTTKVLLLAVFPRGADPEAPATAAVRKKLADVNAQLAKLDDGKTTRYLDIGDKFLNADGIIRYSVMNDALHPTAKGYEIWAGAMKPLLDEMMK
jgi:lysophospholipase L1-like esterase